MCARRPAIELRRLGKRMPFTSTLNRRASESIRVHDGLRGADVQLAPPRRREGHAALRRIISSNANLVLVDFTLKCDRPAKDQIGMIMTRGRSGTADSNEPATCVQRVHTSTTTRTRVCVCVCVCECVCMHKKQPTIKLHRIGQGELVTDTLNRRDRHQFVLPMLRWVHAMTSGIVTQ